MKTKKLLTRIVCTLCECLMLIACGKEGLEEAIPTITPVPTVDAKMFTPLGNEFAVKVQLKITTSSDWTAVRLIEGGNWHEPKIISTSNEAEFAGINGSTISIDQPIQQAQEGTEVEMIVEVSLSGMDAESDVVFEIERGYEGSTQVEISKIVEGIPSEITTLTWSGISPDSRNAQTYEVSTDSFLGSKPNEYIVIGQLNFWYYGPGEFGGFEDAEGDRMTPLTPLLGETYWAADPDVIEQQIEWAVEYGVDAFSIEWTTPRGVGCCGSMEDTLDDVFLKSPSVHKVRFAIFYDFVLRMHQTEGLNYGFADFDNPDIYNALVSDFEHFARKYFDHPQYLTIDDRPVIYIWATSYYSGDLAGAIHEARTRVDDLGFDVYIVGDEVRTDLFDPKHVSIFDATTTFTFLIPGIDWYALKDVGQAAEEVDDAFSWWRSKQSGLKVAGRDDYVNFQPGWAPQYDERFCVEENPKYVPAVSVDQVYQMAEVARKHAEPAGKQNLKLIWLNTWNNWAETTTVEPTANLGSKYPAGNYQFDMLEVVRDVFGKETFYTSPLPQ